MLMSWGSQDVMILRNNCYYFNPDAKLHFLTKYADVQRFSTRILSESNSSSNQLSVKMAADLTDISYDEKRLHDALVDATVSGCVFKKIFDKEILKEYIVNASMSSFTFKDTPVTDINDKRVDRQIFKIRCPKCGRYTRKKQGWILNGNKFSAAHYCRKCRRNYMCTLEILKSYGNVMKYKKRMKLIKSEKSKSEFS